MPRRRGRRWENPASPLQAARFERRWSGKDAVARVRAVCEGHHNSACKLDLSKLSDYETHRRRPSVEHIVAFCKIYEKSAEGLGLIVWHDEDQSEPGATVDPATATASGAARPTGPSGTSGRDVLLRLLGPILGQAPRQEPPGQPHAADEAADPFLLVIQRDHERLAATRLNGYQLERLEAAATRFARDYYLLTEPEQARRLLVVWATARRSLPVPQTLRQRRRLTGVYARLSGILAHLTFDFGYPARARAFLEIAQDAARETGDGELLGWLYALHSMLSDWEEDPRQVLTLACLGLEAAGDSSTSTSAKLHGRAATAHAAMGDQRAATTHLENAMRALSSPNEGCWPADQGMPRGFTYAPDSLAAAAARCDLRLGNHPSAAERSVEAAALQQRHGLSPTTSLAVPLNQLTLATALLPTGDPDRACETARTAIQHYHGVAATRLLRRTRAFADDLAAAYPGTSHSREFTEFLRAQAHAA